MIFKLYQLYLDKKLFKPCLGNILLPRAGSGNVRLMSVTEETLGDHQMLSPSNVMTPHLVLIDFEYASYNYR